MRRMTSWRPISTSSREHSPEGAKETFLVLCVLAGLVAMLIWTYARPPGHRLVDIDEVTGGSEPYCVQFRSATWQDLAQIPGLGEVLAQRIVEARDKGPDMTGLDDLLSVRGIGPQKLAEIGRYIQFSPSGRATADSPSGTESE